MVLSSQSFNSVQAPHVWTACWGLCVAELPQLERAHGAAHTAAISSPLRCPKRRQLAACSASHLMQTWRPNQQLGMRSP